MRRASSFFALMLLAACSSPASPSPAPATSNTDAGTVVDPTAPQVQYIGRVDGTLTGWGGTRIVVRFQGTALSVTIDDEETSDGGSRYDVSVDGQAATTLALSQGAQTYDVAKDLADGTHVVSLARRTEPQVGVATFTSFDLHGGTLLAPPAPQTRHIEFVGDSEIAGYGIECTDPSQSFTADTENETKTYPELVGKALNAEIHNLAYSGKGVLRNGFADGPVYATYYPEAVPWSGASNYDFGWKPDVIWVALGANDYDLGADGSARPAPDPAQFKAAYESLVDLIRTKNPGIPIVLVLEAFPNDDYPAGYQARTTLRTILQSIVADKGLKFAELPQAMETDLLGCDQHPSAAFHATLAPIAQTAIAAAAGW